MFARNVLGTRVNRVPCEGEGRGTGIRPTLGASGYAGHFG